MTDEMPVIDAAGGEPRKWSYTQKFKPEEAAALAELDEFMAYHAGGDEKKRFYFPTPNNGEMVLVYCESYEADDADPELRKRHIVLVEVGQAN